MRALEQTSLDGPQDLRLITDAPVPSPGPGEVLIRVTAAGVNYVDISQARGTFAGGPRPPYLPGIEGAGEVTAVGEEVSDPKPGARVVGVSIAGGAFAEYMTLPAAAALPVPPGWSDEQALGMVVNWPTALAALKPLGRVAEGQTVLIHAAAGGTGQAAVRMAKHYGATVIATASPAKHDAARAQGADHVLDSRRPDLAAEVLRLTDGAGVDLVLESVGGATLDTSLAAAKRVTGRVVVYGLAGGEAAITNWDLVYKHQIHLIGLNIGTLIQAAPQLFGEVMAEMFALLAAGVLGPTRPTTYELAEARKHSRNWRHEPPPANWPSSPDRSGAPRAESAWSLPSGVQPRTLTRTRDRGRGLRRGRRPGHSPPPHPHRGATPPAPDSSSVPVGLVYVQRVRAAGTTSPTAPEGSRRTTVGPRSHSHVVTLAKVVPS